MRPCLINETISRNHRDCGKCQPLCAIHHLSTSPMNGLCFLSWRALSEKNLYGTLTPSQHLTC